MALERLYASTDGPNWRNRDGWLGERGTECHWHGVSCTIAGGGDGDVAESVFELNLMDNDLAGALPVELKDLENLEYLRIYGNRLSGTLPPSIRDRWERGALLVQGYGDLAGVSEISLQFRSSAFCVDYQATLKSDGSVTLSSERCKEEPRAKWQGSDGLGVFCEIRAGRTDSFGDAFGRLVLLVEKEGFSELAAGYSRNITHGGFMTTSVVRKGERKTVTNYAVSGPMNLWVIETAIQGVVHDATWERTAKARRCDWKSPEVPQ